MCVQSLYFLYLFIFLKLFIYLFIYRRNREVLKTITCYNSAKYDCIVICLEIIIDEFETVLSLFFCDST